MSDKFTSEIISGEENLYYELGYRYFSYVQKKSFRFGLHHFSLVLILSYFTLILGKNYLIPLFLLLSLIIGSSVLNLHMSERIYYIYYIVLFSSIALEEYNNGEYLQFSTNPSNQMLYFISYIFLIVNLMVMLMYDTFSLQTIKSKRVITPASALSRENYNKFKQRLKGTSFAIGSHTFDDQYLNRKYLYLQIQTLVFFVSIIFIINSLVWEFFQWFYSSDNIREVYYLGTLTLLEFITLFILLRTFYRTNNREEE